MWRVQVSLQRQVEHVPNQIQVNSIMPPVLRFLMCLIAGYPRSGGLHERAVSRLYWWHKHWGGHSQAGLWSACCLWNTRKGFW